MTESLSVEKQESTVGRIVAIIPAFNEERFIGSVVLKALQHTRAVIVVDDGSHDATAEIAHAAGAIVIRHESNKGKGAALHTGLRHARELCPDAVVILDADGQHLTDDIPSLAQPILSGGADLVVGSRYLENKSRVPTARMWGHRLFNAVTNHASGVPLTDTQSGFRAFSANILQLLSFSSTDFTVESEMQFLAREHRLRVQEVPVTIRYHDKPKRPIIMHGLIVLNGILRLIGQYRPLLSFGVPGLCILLLGLVAALHVLEVYSRLHTLAMGYALAGVVLIVIGVVILFTGIVLHSVRALMLDMVARNDD